MQAATKLMKCAKTTPEAPPLLPEAPPTPPSLSSQQQHCHRNHSTSLQGCTLCTILKDQRFGQTSTSFRASAVHYSVAGEAAALSRL